MQKKGETRKRERPRKKWMERTKEDMTGKGDDKGEIRKEGGNTGRDGRT